MTDFDIYLLTLLHVMITKNCSIYSWKWKTSFTLSVIARSDTFILIAIHQMVLTTSLIINNRKYYPNTIQLTLPFIARWIAPAFVDTII